MRKGRKRFTAYIYSVHCGLHINILLMSDGPEVAAGLVFNQKTKWVCIAPQLIEFHCLPIAARMKFKSLMLTYRAPAGSAPSHLNDLVWAHASPHSPRSAHELHLTKLSLQAWQSIPWYTLLFCGGTTSQILSEQVRPSRPSTSSWRSSSSNSTCSRNGTYLSPLSFSPVYYPYDSLSIALQVS